MAREPLTPRPCPFCWQRRADLELVEWADGGYRWACPDCIRRWAENDESPAPPD